MKNALTATLALSGVMLLQLFIAHPQTPPSKQAAASHKNDDQTSAGIDADVQLLRKNIRSEKKQLIAANLKLTDTEAARFWPIYDQYTAEMATLVDQRYALIKEYAQGFGSTTDAQAISLAKRYLALDTELAQLRSKYLPIVNSVLPGTKTATFFQLDRRITTLIDLQATSQIPLVQDQN